MSPKSVRAAVAGAEPERAQVLESLATQAPVDPMLAVAYWSAIADEAAERMYVAAAEAREAGASWPELAIAYSDRSVNAAYSKFGRRAPDAKKPPAG